MRFLYIFPHPDDESFGPAQVMSQQVKEGHEVHLLTLTHGEATKQRFQFGYSKQQMASVRYEEMQCVQEVLGLDSLEVLNFPDNGLAEMDPREIEDAIESHINCLKPHVVVSYPVYGISGFNDHLVMHAVIKRKYLEMKDKGNLYPKRLAFFTIGKDQSKDGPYFLKASDPALIDCEITVKAEDQQKMKAALDCYQTYQQVIDDTGVRNNFGDKVLFELYGEDFKPPLNALSEQLPNE